MDRLLALDLLALFSGDLLLSLWLHNTTTGREGTINSMNRVVTYGELNYCQGKRRKHQPSKCNSAVKYCSSQSIIELN